MRVYSYGWYSHRVNKHMEFLHYGHAGAPVVIFPTSGGDHREFGDRGMVEPLAGKIDEGFIQLFCVDTNNWDGWYNDGIHPRQRVERYEAFEGYLMHEFYPHVANVTGSDYRILTGISFGGYIAMNFTLKHPDLVSKCVVLSGSFDIKGLLDGYYDELCYFNNPVDYLPNLSDPWYLNLYNSHTEIVMVTGDSDVCLDRNYELARIFDAKGIRHSFHRWDGGYRHDWPYWKEMIGHYI